MKQFPGLPRPDQNGLQARTAYELVVVEHVWGDPVITIVRNPLGRLKYYLVGNVVVEGWRDLRPPAASGSPAKG